jgi:hypothetical protein
MFVAILVLLRTDRRVMAVFLPDPDLPDAVAEAEMKLRKRVDEIAAIISSPDFLASKRSGIELIQIAARAASEHGRDVSDFRQPHVSTTVIDTRFFWRLSFMRKYPDGYLLFPAETFTVTIDDESGIATFEDTSARL